MGASINGYFYHNITKEVMNYTDILDFIEEYEEGNKIYKTEIGCALMEVVLSDEIENLKERYNELMQDLSNEADWHEEGEN